MGISPAVAGYWDYSTRILVLVVKGLDENVGQVALSGRQERVVESQCVPDFSLEGRGPEPASVRE